MNCLGCSCNSFLRFNIAPKKILTKQDNNFITCIESYLSFNCPFVSLCKCQRLTSCSCEWSYCIKISLGDKMHFIHSTSVFDDRDSGVSLEELWCLHVLIFHFQHFYWVSCIFLGLKKNNCGIPCTCWKQISLNYQDGTYLL